MDGMNTFINNASRDTGLKADFCDKVICSMVKAVNNNALDGPTQLAQLSRLKKKKFTNRIEFSTNGHQMTIECAFMHRKYNTLTTPRRKKKKKYKRVSLREILPL